MGAVKDPHVQLAHQVLSPALFQQIDDLTTQLNSVDYVTNLKDITRHHWVPSEGKLACYNRACRKQFSLFERGHHCRKCGEVFCVKCVTFQRRLNRLAHFDPDGELHKVCQYCFERDKLSEGQLRSHTKDFTILRARYKEGMVMVLNSSSPSTWRNKINFDREIERLVKGFEKSVGDSGLQRTFHDIKTTVFTPDWMKSSVWMLEQLSTKCQTCCSLFGLLSRKLWCRVCGIVICSKCSSRDLLVYVKVEDKTGRASLAIIKIIGSPSEEPKVSMYLIVCHGCRDRLIQLQVAKHEHDEKEEFDGREDFMASLLRLHEKFNSNEMRVKQQLPKYKEITESLVDGSRRSSSDGNMKTLAKAQEDLADVLSQHITVVHQLKRLRPMTNAQSCLLKKYITAKCDFYLDNMSDFRCVKHKLSESVPPESLDFIQRVMDKNAIISTHLYLRQLVYESIHLCGKYDLEESIPSLLMAIETHVESDVCKCLKGEREDVDEHMEIVKEMIKSRMKNNRLIKPSQRLIKRQGSVHVMDVINSRTDVVLSQVSVQLQLASAHRSFPSSKSALEKALHEVKEQRSKVEDFVVVDKV